MLWRVLRNIWRVEVSGLRWAHTPRGCVAGSGYLAPERRLFRGLGEIGSELGRTPAPGAFSSIPHGKAQLTRFGSRDTGGSLSVQFAHRGSLREGTSVSRAGRSGLGVLCRLTSGDGPESCSPGRDPGARSSRARFPAARPHCGHTRPTSVGGLALRRWFAGAASPSQRQSSVSLSRLL